MTGTYWAQRGQDHAASATTFYQIAALNDGLGPNLFVKDITGAKIAAYRAARRGAGLSPSSINREITLLRSIMNYASRVHDQPVPRIAWPDLKMAEPPGRTRFLSADEFARLSEACGDDDELRTIIVLAVSTGLRRSNVTGLDWNEVDLGAGRARFVTKGGKAHVVKLAGHVVAALARTKPDDRKGPVFTKPNFRKRWEKAVAVAALYDFRFHDLRHTFASWARMRGADIADVRDALNHSDISMTMRYAHITPDTHRTAFDVVAEAFQPAAAQSTTHDDEKPQKSAAERS